MKQYRKANPLHVTFQCDGCGKVAHPSRKGARRAARDLGPGLSVYLCQVAPSYADERWHVGHPPPELKVGAIARADVSSRDRRRLEGRPS